jgi:hypothetical protein
MPVGPNGLRSITYGRNGTIGGSMTKLGGTLSGRSNATARGKSTRNPRRFRRDSGRSAVVPSCAGATRSVALPATGTAPRGVYPGRSLTFSLRLPIDTKPVMPLPDSVGAP